MENDVNNEVDFEVIIVGAGIAGCVAALKLADKGYSVLLAERGQSAGSKNLSGGVFYCRVMEDVIPNFVKKAPIERYITRNCISFLNESSFVNINYGDARLENSVTAVSVKRAKLDEWLAQQCEDAGVTFMSGIRVDELLMDGDKVVGIQAGDDKLYSHVVIAADGVNSLLCRNAGIRNREPLENLAVGIKSVIGLPKDIIEERFHLKENEGAAYAVVGDCTNGLNGGGFIYTNSDSISIGVVVKIDALAESRESASDLHDRFLSHPAIEPLLRGGELLEYGCHMVPEGGQAMLHDLTRAGLIVIGDAAGLALNTGSTVRGMDLAAGSGIAAAKVVDEVLSKKDFSQAAMDAYYTELNNIFVGKDMKTYAKMPGFLENPRMYKNYGPLLGDIMYNIYNLDTTLRQHMMSEGLKIIKKNQLSAFQLIKDMYTGVRAL